LIILIKLGIYFKLEIVSLCVYECYRVIGEIVDHLVLTSIMFYLSKEKTYNIVILPSF